MFHGPALALSLPIPPVAKYNFHELPHTTTTWSMSSPGKDDDIEVDDEFAPDPAMAAALGFSSFGAQPSTRKKYNDAVVDITTTAPSMKGANALPLGKKRKASPQVASVPAAKKPAPRTTQGILSAGTTSEATAELTANAREAADTTTASRPPLSRHDPVTESLLQSWNVSTQGPRRFTAMELQALREGIRTSKGHVAYFLPSFVEDPWAKIRAQATVDHERY
jgi:hypothetical protein